VKIKWIYHAKNLKVFSGEKAMKLTQITCPSCGGPISHEITQKQPFRCSACGSLLIMAASGKPAVTICPHCQTENNALNKYCSVCSTKLLVDCPVCYLPNVVGSVFCQRCGANIQDELLRRATWRDLKKQYDRRRKDALVKALEEDQRAELERLLAELDEPERHAFAIFYLCQQGEAAFEPLLETLRHDQDPDARYGAARALGMMDDSKAIPDLVAALSDEEPAVRYWAIDSLVLLNAIGATEAIRELEKDAFKWVRERAKSSLKELDRESL
jgi:uncharacterized Zn finger protein (UPF0148 family)